MMRVERTPHRPCRPRRRWCPPLSLFSRYLGSHHELILFRGGGGNRIPESASGDSSSKTSRDGYRRPFDRVPAFGRQGVFSLHKDINQAEDEIGIPLDTSSRKNEAWSARFSMAPITDSTCTEPISPPNTHSLSHIQTYAFCRTITFFA